MRKQLRIITALRLAVDPWSKETYPLPNIPRFAHSKYLRRRTKYRYDKMRVVDLTGGWYILCYPNGRRMLSALPF